MISKNSHVLIQFFFFGFLVFIGSCSRNPGKVVADDVPDAFTQLCAACHGGDLKGGIAQSLLDGSWQFGSRRNDIFRSIKFGHPHHGMPSWGLVLADEEIDTLVGYLLYEEERLGITKPPIPTTLETQDYPIDVEIFAKELETPWSIDFISSDRALITERSGRLRIWENGMLLADSVRGIPRVRQGGQGGLMDVAIDPDYDSNGWIYLAFSHGIAKQDAEERAPAMTSIARGRIIANTWRDQQILFEAPHDSYRTAGQHFGSRIVFDPEGHLYFSIGDRGASDHAQDLSKPNGKIHRIHTDGQIPRTNPFYGQEGVVTSIYSYGHRNPQGLAIHPQTGQVWSTEHGPLGGDELNLIQPGVNYGWPVISYGINYNGVPITDIFRKEGMEQPILYWKPSIAVCGLDFYSGDLFPEWNNRLLVGALKFEEVQLLDMEKDRVIYQQTILKNAGRVRDVTTGPDGAIYVVLNRPGVVLRLSPQPEM
ncbi:MAG: PQQ-dependent sugar dehydrogenase [Saprospiraceae bacterium]|nr:PQQ-dependent sugar dehydrogenase [Saprospiraceae bacterium]